MQFVGDRAVLWCVKTWGLFPCIYIVQCFYWFRQVWHHLQYFHLHLKWFVANIVIRLPYHNLIEIFNFRSIHKKNVEEIQFSHLWIISAFLQLANQTPPSLTHHFSNQIVKHTHMKHKIWEIYCPLYALDSLSITIIIEARVQQSLQLVHVNERA